MMSNSAVGDRFQVRASIVLGQFLGEPLVARSLLIGQPARPHEFDLVSPDLHYAGEAKAYAWTATDNTPSAKIGHLKETLQFLHLLPSHVQTFVVMKRHCRYGHGEPLANYFVRRHAHLLRTTVICELCEETNALRFVFGELRR